MERSQAHALKSLLESQPLACLATLHRGDPAASMVPFALLPEAQGFVIHVSRLATHTGDMQAHPAVGLMVMDSVDRAASPLSVARASVNGHARQCLPQSPEYAPARDAYLRKLPQSQELFSFSDFSLFLIAVRSVRFVAGFAQATSMTAEQFAAIMKGPA